MDPVSQGAVGAAFAQSAAKKDNIILVGFIGFLAGLAPDLDVLIQSSVDPILFLSITGSSVTHFFLFPLVLWSFLSLFSLLLKRL